MRLFAAVRSSGALWFVPVMFALGTLMPSSGYYVSSGYAVADISASGIALSYGGPLLAGFTAFWFRGRARFHRTIRSTRPGAAVLLTGGWPLILGAPLAGCLAVLVSARTLPSDLVSAQLLVVFFAVLVACSLFGALTAWALPVVIAVPAAAVACFMWISYLPATRSPLLHHLSPTIDGFATTTRPATSGIVAVLILTGVIMLGAAACLGRRTWDRTPRLAAVPLMLAVPVAAFGLSAGYLHTFATSMNLMVTEPRTTALTCSTHEGVQVCLWPEVAPQATQVAEAAASMNVVLTAWGLPLIEQVGQGPDLTAGAVNFRGDRDSAPEQVLVTLAGGYVEQQKSSCANGEGQAYAERVAVLARSQGVPSAELVGGYSQETLEAANQALSELGERELGAWFADGIDDVRCWPPA